MDSDEHLEMNGPINLTQTLPFREGLDIGGAMPELRNGDTLLRPPAAGEARIYGDDLWVPDELDRLKYHAYQFWICAIDLVKLWLYRRHDSPEHVAYVVGYLYRHAIELQLKAIIAEGGNFRRKTTLQQAQTLRTHDIEELWGKVGPTLHDTCDDAEFEIAQTILRQVGELDRRSDGFRFPFSFERRTGDREATLRGFSNASFDNFVWVLESLMTWLTSLEERRLA